MDEAISKWSAIQATLNKRTKFLRPKSGEVWWCAIGMNVGSEQRCLNGFERPVLVLKVFGNLFWGLPITSSDPNKYKADNPLFCKLQGIPYTDGQGRGRILKGYIALHQLRVFDARRLNQKILKANNDLFEHILSEVRKLL